MTKQLLQKQDLNKVSLSPKNQPSKRQKRKGEIPIWNPPTTEPSSGPRIHDTWICRNSACRAKISIYDTFCKRCSCFICHEFDENKDPSLWLECASDSPADSCGSSCHIECVFQRRIVGVVDLGPMMQLDGSYCCASCDKVSEVLGYWKKQLIIAKDSRRIDHLCYRLNLSFRLFDGTSRFQDLHNIVKEAKTKLETEVGPLAAVSAMMSRGIVSRLPVAGEVQLLCNAAVQLADEVYGTPSSASLGGVEISLPAALGPPFVVSIPHNEGTSGSKDYELDSSFRELGKVLQLTSVDLGQDTPGADMNVDLNDDAVPPTDASRGKADHGSVGSETWAQHGPNVEGPAVDSRAVEGPAVDSRAVEGPAVDSRAVEGPAVDSRAVEGPAVDSRAEGSKSRPASTEVRDGNLDISFDTCVETIRSLECKGHIKRQFRLKLLTWFSLWATEKERRIVHTFIRTLADDPSSLAEQLVDTFTDIITSNRP